MKIRILSPAERDLEEGYHFYESQSPGLGSYFLDSLYPDIDSLHTSAAFTNSFLDTTANSPSDSHSPYIIESLTMTLWFLLSLIAAVTRVG